MNYGKNVFSRLPCSFENLLGRGSNNIICIMRRQDTGWLWSYNIKIHSKSELVSLKLYRDYSNLLTLSNAGKLIRTISKSRKRKKKCYCIIAVMAVWGSEFYCLCYYFLCVSEFSNWIFLGVSQFSRYWRGLCFLDLGYPGYQRFFLTCDRGAFHTGHFLRLDRNWKPCMKSLCHPGKIWGV